jgi:glutamate--cysteine ligase catalytic subunit
LRLGNPLRWQQSKPFLQHVRKSGVNQFISHYQRCKDFELSHFYWGDEIEYGIFVLNGKGNYDLSYAGTKIRERLAKEEKNYADLPIGCEWQPEYGAWMVEAVPKNPYGSYISDLLNVEKSMQLRRKRLHSVLRSNEIAPTLSNFPMLGVPGYTHTQNTRGEIANSEYISDEIINPHPRFGALTRNIRERKGSNVNIEVAKEEGNDSDKIHMDAMAFGMGCCCLQVTMQCRNEDESRYLNDQLAVLAPIIQSLSAASPAFRGNFTSTDTRWDIISQAVDDRTPVENGTITDPTIIASSKWNDSQLAGNGIQRLQKSRYSTVSMFINKPKTDQERENLNALNDLPVDINQESFEHCLQSGLDEVLSKHIAHLFTRDPLVIFDDAIYLNNSESMVRELLFA